MLHIPQGMNLGANIKLIKINRNLSSVSSRVRTWIKMSMLKTSNNEKKIKEQKGTIVNMLLLTFSYNYKHAFAK